MAVQQAQHAQAWADYYAQQSVAIASGGAAAGAEQAAPANTGTVTAQATSYQPFVAL